VQVLQHEQRPGRRAQLAQQRGDELRRPGAGGRRREQLAARGVGHVLQRAERARRVQRVAGAPQHAPPLGERAHQRGLADAGLTADQHEPAGRAGEDFEKRLALQEHEAIVTAAFSRARELAQESRS
jgi:hypothetical protein